MSDELFTELPEALRLLAESLTPVAPPVGLKERLMSRVAQFEHLKPAADIRRDEGAWVATEVPGIAIKALFTDTHKRTATLLMRMDPGVRYPAHNHHGAEQCLVLKGDVRWGDLVYEEGDFLVMGKGSHHPEITTVHGNLLLLVSGGMEFVHA
ncbi:MAG: anti-ECFsigma factor, ChrR [Candidatus Solibacter sp.]|jgi:anti-sigma factor ChrR (cupin superfamily)|nr:anti-ECFsigma factor, ChrR [Candidatus Solibacter sp.]